MASGDDGFAAAGGTEVLALALRLRVCDPRFVRLAPDIRPELFAQAFQKYLDLQADEEPIAVLGAQNLGWHWAATGCTVTTRRLYWQGRDRDPSSDRAEGRPARCRSLDLSRAAQTRQHRRGTWSSKSPWPRHPGRLVGERSRPSPRR